MTLQDPGQAIAQAPATAPVAPDPDKLHAFMGKMVGELGATISTALALLGDHLGLYKALQAHGPATSVDLARATKLNERLIREWLAAQAAAEYIDYDPVTGRFSLSPEQAMVFADEDSPVFMGGAFELMSAVFKDEPKVAKAFQSGLAYLTVLLTRNELSVLSLSNGCENSVPPQLPFAVSGAR